MSHPCQILMLSKDTSLLAPQQGFGNALARHRRYAEKLNALAPGSQLRILTLSSALSPERKYMEGSRLLIRGTRSLSRVSFVCDIRRIVEQWRKRGWLPQVITAQTPYEEGGVGLSLAQEFGAKFIGQLHFDLFSDDWKKESIWNGLRGWAAKRNLAKADAVRVVSSSMKSELHRALGFPEERICVIPVTSSSMSLFEDSKDSFKHRLDCAGYKVVLFVGKAYTPKNLNNWVTVAKRITEKVADVRFVIAGDGPDLPRMKDDASKLGIGSKFVFLGHVQHSKLAEIYRAADVFLLTSSSESFGRVLIEAATAELPVVATRCAGPIDIVKNGETGWLCEIDAIEAITHKTCELLQDETLRQKMGKAARKHVDEVFSGDGLVDDLVNFWLRTAA